MSDEIATVEELERAIQAAILEALCKERKIPVDFNPLDTPLLRRALDAVFTKAVKDDLSRLTFAFEEDRDARRSIIHVSGPPDVMARIGWGRDERFSGKVNVRIEVEP